MSQSRSSGGARVARVSLILIAASALVVAGGGAASAAPIGLGEASSFAVLAGSTVTNVGPSVIDGNVGVSPGLAVVGFPPASLVAASLIYSGAPAATPKLDLTTAYDQAAAAINTPVPTELGNTAPAPGVYAGELGTLGITGDLVLDAGGDPSAVWIFQAPSTLITASGSRVILTNGASACNVYWQVGTSATLGTGSTMVGTVMALASISSLTGASVTGRLLARNGAVTLDTTTITTPSECITPSTFPFTGGVDSSAGTVGGVPGAPGDAVPGAGLPPTGVAGESTVRLVTLVVVMAGVGTVLLLWRRRMRA